MNGGKAQLSLFADDVRVSDHAVGPAPRPPLVAALAARLPAHVRLGTSSWSFPGWHGLVYDRKVSEGTLARHGLPAYAQHPLLRTVGVDRGHYAPISLVAYAQMRNSVPDDFRFLVKAHEVLTLRRFPGHPRYGQHRGRDNPQFLDAAYARDVVVMPYMEGLGDKAGTLLFQFAPQEVALVGGPQRFAARLHAFLSLLPRGPLYSVEVRNPQLLVPALAAAIADAGCVPCLNAIHGMPGLADQAQVLWPTPPRAVVVRWLLRREMTYDEARVRHAPFDRLVDEDPPVRDALARLLLETSAPAFVIVNNKAEGSAPLSIERLAERLVAVA